MRYLITSVNWSGIGHVLAASLPVVISAIVTYIAAQQYAVNRRQHRLALFEKRSTGIHLSGKPTYRELGNLPPSNFWRRG